MEELRLAFEASGLSVGRTHEDHAAYLRSLDDQGDTQAQAQAQAAGTGAGDADPGDAAAGETLEPQGSDWGWGGPFDYRTPY